MEISINDAKTINKIDKTKRIITITFLHLIKCNKFGIKLSNDEAMVKELKITKNMMPNAVAVGSPLLYNTKNKVE